jgi:hypothetical protein
VLLEFFDPCVCLFQRGREFRDEKRRVLIMLRQCVLKTLHITMMRTICTPNGVPAGGAALASALLFFAREESGSIAPEYKQRSRVDLRWFSG